MEQKTLPLEERVPENQETLPELTDEDLRNLGIEAILNVS